MQAAERQIVDDVIKPEADKPARPAEEQKPEVEKSPTPQSTKKKGGKLKWVLLALAIIIVLPILYLGWLGFVPGLSNLLGAHNPKDLGVSYTEADLASYHDKTGSKELNFADAPAHPTKAGKKSVFVGKADIDQSFTQEELTARVNLSSWSQNPFRDVQIRVSDGRIEASGVLILDRLDEFISLIGGVAVSQEDIDNAVPWIERFVGEPALYIDANASVTNNRLTMSINSAKVGRLSIPASFADEVFVNATDSILAGIPGFNMDSVTMGDGVLNFSGTGPQEVYVQQ